MLFGLRRVDPTSINHKPNSFSRDSGQSNAVTVKNLNIELPSGNQQLVEEKKGKKKKSVQSFEEYFESHLEIFTQRGKFSGRVYIEMQQVCEQGFCARDFQELVINHPFFFFNFSFLKLGYKYPAKRALQGAWLKCVREEAPSRENEGRSSNELNARE